MKDLEKALTEQFMDLKVNDIESCEGDNLPIYFEGSQEDYLQWIKLLRSALVSARSFEIHCWNEED